MGHSKVKRAQGTGGSRISGKGVQIMYKGVGVRLADFISFFLKGTATLMITMFYMKDLNKP